MTESSRAGHYSKQGTNDVASAATSNDGAREQPTPSADLTITALYENYFEFVWRSLKHLGVPDAAVEDATQDTFLVAHRRLADFAGRSSPRTWLFGIAIRVASDYRRSRGRRERLHLSYAQKPEGAGATPYDHTLRAEATRILHACLDGLTEEQRAVFVMADLEQMTAPEISETLGANLNTVYSRLRTARAAFNEAVARVTGKSNRERHD